VFRALTPTNTEHSLHQREQPRMAEAAVILSVETATLGGSVCIARGNKVLASSVGNPEISHSNSLLNDITECLATAQVLLRGIDLFAAASGPGSFTGLRIGLATVKALSATLGRPCVGIPTLHAIAHAAGPSTATLALLPAGRGEVFVQMFSVSKDANVIALDTPAHLAPQQIFARYSANTTIKLSGPGAHVHHEFLRELAQKNGTPVFDELNGSAERDLQPGWTLTPMDRDLSQSVAALALQELDRDNVGSAHSLSAIYVRPSDAELKCL
jgi:tRNA threonylcarbamoyladenosine biosynthesis protein TsaB